MNRERFLVKSYGDNPAGVTAGLVKLLELLPNHKDAVIVVPEMGKVSGTMLVPILGEDLSKRLIKNREILFDDGSRISLCAQATLKNYRRADAYLVLWGSKYAIQDVEALDRWKSLVLVTWMPEDSAEWEAENKVSVIYDDGRNQ
ncbi:hypothetical protein A6V36_13940 [Paraburkholderia ginsengiterrae]|uniref:Uncharacterized protein n=1 Tax=Paraburkholderia ginsengiterrae TaxID=1462993 RepID=A0A1A9MY48_9BURK|nr:hypothetical protein [Paraburkholderia ginsengiterrae]OAJ52503.1 hypothetical protein A6V36_13940 [Paraburkholderia ginsengiterrae]OAJ52621.1 hypothetical protein A6V37_09260 [Paraburkholderia ginsengiterrae]